MIDNWMEYITLFIIILVFVVALISMLTIINTMIINIYDRLKEIGIIKTIGVSKIQVISIFVFEGMMLDRIGSVLGVGMGILTSRIIIYILRWNFRFSLNTIVIAFIIGILST